MQNLTIVKLKYIISIMTDIFIERLRELIGNESITKIGKESGISISTISLYLSGKRKPIIDNIIKLSKYFHVSSDYLLGLVDKPNAKGEVPMDYHELKEKAQLLETLQEEIEILYNINKGENTK